jgi:hypothetical protein
MREPPFSMSMYATELDLLRDKCAWQEAEIQRLRGPETNECICPTCGIRHGGRRISDPGF